MAIEINDLPLLKDLTPEQLKELVGAGRFRPQMELLEDRLVQSGYDLTSAVVSTSTAGSTWTTAAYTPLAPAATAVVAVIPAQEAALAPVAASDAYAALYSPTLDLTAEVAPAGANDAVLAAAYGQLSDPVALPFLGGQTQEQGRIAIENKAAQFAAFLGRPLGNWGNSSGASEPTADGIGRMQAFENGSIYWSPVTGAHVVRREVLNGYLRAGGTAQLGYPSTDSDYVSGFGAAATFKNDFFINASGKTSTIVYTDGINGRDAFVVSGSIREWWAQHGFASYGLPVGQQYAIRAGVASPVAQDFVVKEAGGGNNFATIVSSKEAGTHDVRGIIRSTWERAGRPGLPTTDQTGIDSSSNNFARQVVHFKRSGNDYFAIGAASGRSAFFVGGYIYLAWNSSGGQAYGVPISPERSYASGERTMYTQQFLNRDGSVRTIYWTPDRGGPSNWGIAALAGISGDNSHFYEDLGDGAGGRVMDFTPKAGPTGLEPVIGRASAPLTTDGSSFDASALYQTTVQNQSSLGAIYGSSLDLSAAYGEYASGAQASAVYGNLLDPAPAYQDAYEATPNVTWADDANLFQEMEAIEGNAFPFTPPSPSSEPLPWDSIGAYIGETPVNPDIGDWAEYTAGQEIPPVLDSGNPTFRAAIPSSREGLQARLAELGEVLVQGQQELQGALDSQNQQQIALLQNQLGLFATEQTLIRYAIADADVASFNQAQQDLRTALDAQAQSLAQSKQVESDIQTTTLALRAAEPNLAARSAAVAKAEAAFNQSNQSTLTYRTQVAKKTELQAKAVQANVTYQKALKAQQANRNKKLNASLLQAVNKAKTALNAVTAQLKAQSTVVQNAGTKLKADAPALQKAKAALELARAATASARLARDQAAKGLTDSQATQARLATELAQVQQHIVEAQSRVDQLTRELAGVQNALAALQTNPAFAGAAEAVTAQDAVPDVAALAAQFVGDLGLGSYHPEWTADNWLGLNERWILSDSNQWYFITSDGGLYRYSGSKEAENALLATLDQSYWEDLGKLLGAANQPVQAAPVQEVMAQTAVSDSQPDVAARAAQLVGELGLGSYHPEWTADNWLGRDERWILSHSNQWYFITPDGGLYRYGGSKGAENSLLATLDQSYWTDLDKLTTA